MRQGNVARLRQVFLLFKDSVEPRNVLFNSVGSGMFTAIGFRILENKLIAYESRFFLFPHTNHPVSFFKDSSEAASPNRRCPWRDLEILVSRRP